MKIAMKESMLAIMVTVTTFAQVFWFSGLTPIFMRKGATA